MTTFYCLNRACRKPIEVQRTIPALCPHCHEEFSASTTAPLAEPPTLPTFEATLSEWDTEFLKIQRIKR